jgi:hypothetical protein
MKMKTITPFLAALLLAASVHAEATPKDMVDAVVVRPGKGENHPVLPSLPTDLRFKIMNQLATSQPIREAYAKLDAGQRNVSWFEGIAELEKQKAVWPLLSVLCHHSEDAQVYALRSLRQVGDKKAVPFLLIYADYMAVWEEGSENATVHGVVHTEIAKTLSSLTGIQVDIKGQDVEGLKKGIHLWKKWQVQEEEKKGPNKPD